MAWALPPPPSAGGPVAAAAGPCWEARFAAWLSRNAVSKDLAFAAPRTEPVRRALPSQTLKCFSLSPGWLLPTSFRITQRTYRCMGTSKANDPGKVAFWGEEYTLNQLPWKAWAGTRERPASIIREVLPQHFRLSFEQGISRNRRGDTCASSLFSDSTRIRRVHSTLRTCGAGNSSRVRGHTHMQF